MLKTKQLSSINTDRSQTGSQETETFAHFPRIQDNSRLEVQCRFTSTETIRTVRDGEPRTATSTFTQLLSSELRLQ